MTTGTARLMLEANIVSRAARLWADGYTAEQWDTFTDTYTVISPKGDRYTVVLPNEGSTAKCSCPCFTEHQVCKHLYAMQAEAERNQAMCDAHDAEEFGRFDMLNEAAERSLIAA